MLKASALPLCENRFSVSQCVKKLTLYGHTDSHTKLPLGGFLPYFFVAHNLYNNLKDSTDTFVVFATKISWPRPIFRQIHKTNDTRPWINRDERMITYTILERDFDTQ